MDAFFTAFGVDQFSSYLLGAIMIILLPGPNSIYVLTLSAQKGYRAGWRAACGVFTGDFILITLTAAGAATVLKAYPPIFLTIKYLGALYLLYLGFRLLQDAYRSWVEKNIDQVVEASLSQTQQVAVKGQSPFRKALLISLLNPKAIIFLLSFFVQFINPVYAQPVIPFMVLGMTLQILSFIYLATLIYVGARLAAGFRRRKKLAAVSSASVGGVFIGFAGKLMMATV